MSVLRLVSLLLCCAAWSATVAAATPAPARGKLLIAGGAISTSRAEVWRVMLSERLPGRPIGIISTASARPADTGEPLALSLNQEHGANTARFIPLDSALANAAAPEILDLLRQCGGFYFTGGSQTLTARALLRDDGTPTPALDEIRRIHRAGGVIGGSSAGAAVMSHPMITGGTSSGALARAATPEKTPRERQGVLYGPGLGFSPGILYCQHHLERGRFGRLLAALVSESFGLSIGFGISEDTALVVDHAADIAEVIGARDVLHVRTDGAVRSADGSIRGARLDYLTRGDRVRLSTGQVIVAPDKSPLASSGDAVTLRVKDAWAREALRRPLHQLAHLATPAKVVAADPQFEVLMQRGKDTRAWQRPATNTESRDVFTLTGLSVEIRPIGKTAGPAGLPKT